MSQLVFHCPPVCPAFSLRPTFKNSSKGRTPAPVLPQVLLTFISLFLPPLLPSPPSVSGGGGGPTCRDASILPLTSARLSTCAGEVLPQRTSHPSVPPPLRPSPLLFSSLLFFLISLLRVFSAATWQNFKTLQNFKRKKHLKPAFGSS